MSQDLIIQIFREFLKTSLLLMMPMLLASMVVGLTIAIFQAATQIHEMTLVFVPKIIAIAFTLMVVFPWLINHAVVYTSNLFMNIPQYVK